MGFAMNLKRNEDRVKRGRGARLEDSGVGGWVLVAVVLHAAPFASTGSVLQCSRQM